MNKGIWHTPRGYVLWGLFTIYSVLMEAPRLDMGGGYWREWLPITRQRICQARRRTCGGGWSITEIGKVKGAASALSLLSVLARIAPQP
jgi:hypothetical protein